MKDLTRNTLLAVPLALLIYTTVLPHHGTPMWDLLDAFTLAFSFTYLGHWVEVWLRKIPDIDTSTGKIIRVIGWFAGGSGATRWRAGCCCSTAAVPPSCRHCCGVDSFLSEWSSSCTRSCRPAANQISIVASCKRQASRKVQLISPVAF